MKLNSNDVVLFSGDSITHGNRGLCMDCNHIMGHGYQYTVASKLALENAAAMPKFINKGYSGYTMGMLLEKWQEDVIANKPTVLSILAGINDCHAGYNQGKSGEEIAEKYAKDLAAAVDLTKNANPDTKIIILEPFYFPLDKTYLDYRYTPHPDCEPEFLRPDRDDTDECCRERVKSADLVRKAARQVAAEKADVFVPLYDRIKEEAAKSRMEYFIWDGTHPTIACHALIADEWLKAAEKAL